MRGGIYDFNCKTVGTITARYYKGIAGHGDNLIIEVKSGKQVDSNRANG